MKNLFIPILLFSIFFTSEYEGPNDEAGDVSAIRSSHMDGNRVYLYFQNTSELSDWEPGGLDNVSIWPNDGTGTRMVDGIALLVGGKVYIQNDENPSTIDTIVVDDIEEIQSTSSLHELYLIILQMRKV